MQELLSLTGLLEEEVVQLCLARGAFVESDGPHEREELAKLQRGTQTLLELGGGLVVFRIGGVVVVVFGVVVMVVVVVVVVVWCCGSWCCGRGVWCCCDGGRGGDAPVVLWQLCLALL